MSCEPNNLLRAERLLLLFDRMRILTLYIYAFTDISLASQ